MGWKGVLADVYHFAIRVMCIPLYALPEAQRNLALSSLYERTAPVLSVKTQYGDIKFFSPSTKVAWRINTFHKKEPETLRWIDEFEQTDVFWDIGANIGTYSLYAAKRKVKTFSFEPAFSNFHLLNYNIELNGLNEDMVAFCCGLDREDYVGRLLMSTTGPGNALSLSCTEGVGALKIRSVDFSVSFSQGLGTYAIDSLVRSPDIDFPNHIKIDVDGIEMRIIEGARETLQDDRLRSVLVELDSRDAEQIARVTELFKAAGMRLEKKNQSEMARKGRFSSQFNYIFSK